MKSWLFAWKMGCLTLRGGYPRVKSPFFYFLARTVNTSPKWLRRPLAVALSPLADLVSLRSSMLDSLRYNR